MHVAHHMRGSQSQSSSATPLVSEFVDACVESAKWGYEAPNIIVRAHSHKFRQFEISSGHTIIALPCWQAATPYGHRIQRFSAPDVGGVVVITENNSFEVHSKVFPWPKPHIEEIGENVCQQQNQVQNPNPSVITRIGSRLFKR